MSTMVERVAAKMSERRRELIAQPLNRVWDELARAAIEAMVPFVNEMPPARLIGTSDTDPGRIWSIAAEAQLGSVVGHLQAALKEQA
jgi:hypothetical protein